MLRLSIIVPFYNAEQYIEQCIRSLYTQDIPWEDYEVICVDDCSSDCSRDIVERLQKEYLTLKLLVHAKNIRQGGARNTALNIAQGSYIWFVDSDDCIEKHCLKGLLDTAEKNHIDLLKFYSKKIGHVFLQEMVSYGPCTGTEFVFDAPISISSIERCSGVCDGLISRELIQNNSIKFAENVQYEDDDFSYQICAFASRCQLIAESLYMVRDTINSTTRRSNDLRRVVDIYSQAIRMVRLIPKLSAVDNRWHNLIMIGLRDSFENQIFKMLKDCTFLEQLHFWMIDSKNKKCFRKYLGFKSYFKLKSYIAWIILQK